LELKCPEKGTQSIGEFVPPPEIRTGFYKVSIAEYHQPVNQKHQKIQNTLYLAGMPLTGCEIVFQAGVTPWILYDFRCPRRLNRYQEGFNRKGLIDQDRKTKKLAFDVMRKFYGEL
jgi:hypothetical protein